MKGSLSLLILVLALAAPHRVSAGDWVGEWRADYWDGGSCNLWNTYTEPGQAPISVVNVSFLRYFTLDGAPPDFQGSFKSAGLTANELVFSIGTFMPDNTDLPFTPIDTVILGSTRLNSSTADGYRLFFVGEPASSKILASMVSGDPATIELQAQTARGTRS